MKPFRSFTTRSAARTAILGWLVAAQGLAALAGGPGYAWRYPGGHDRGYRGAPYRRGGWYGGWRPGFFFPALPFGYLTLTFAGAPWYYGGGYWYRTWDDGYIADLPPVGMRVPSLPPDCSSYPYAGATFYFANGVWYKADPMGPGYVVCTSPAGRETPPAQPPAAGDPEDAGLIPLILFPRKGQTEEQMLADRREAQRHAAGKSGYDPARSNAADPGVPRARQNYLQNLKAFLEGRGYSVK